MWELFRIYWKFGLRMHLPVTTHVKKSRNDQNLGDFYRESRAESREVCFEFVKFGFQFGKGGGVPARNTQPTVSVAGVPPQPPAEKKQHSTSKLQVGDVNRMWLYVFFALLEPCPYFFKRWILLLSLYRVPSSGKRNWCPYLLFGG